MLAPLDDDFEDIDVDTSMDNVSIPDGMFISDEESAFEGFA